MVDRKLVSRLAGGTVGAAVILGMRYAEGRVASGRKRAGTDGAATGARGQRGLPLAAHVPAGVAASVVTGVAVDALIRWQGRLARLEQLMPKPQISATCKQVVKPTPDTLFANRGSGSDFETRLSTLDGYLVPNDRFFIRSHSPTPCLDAASWHLAIEGTGVRTPVALTYDEVCAMPQVTVTRTIECSGNGRRFFKEAFGVEGEGGQWRTGAIGAAEWTGVRLRDVLARAGLTDAARDVMPEGLDDHRVRRPMPLAKALADDTLLVLKMNGETLPPDHGFPARVLVPGWTGTASVKWVGRIEVAQEPLHSPWNTVEYVLVGPHYPTRYPALGPPVTEMPVMSVIDLDWPARLDRGAKTIRGRSFAGEGKVREVAYSIDDGPWRNAELLAPNIEASWVRWQFEWDAAPGEHEIRVRATDERGRTQPDMVPWNHHGYLYNAVVAHPVRVD